MKKRLTALMMVTVSMFAVGCGSTGIDGQTTTQTEVTTEATVEITTTIEVTTTTTEPQKTIDDFVNEMKNDFAGTDNMKVLGVTDEKEIVIYTYQEGLHDLANRSRVGSYFSFDSWEIWNDLKTNMKGVTETYHDMLTEWGLSEYSVVWYILDDYQMSGFPDFGEEYSFIMEVANGYCYYDCAE